MNFGSYAARAVASVAAVLPGAAHAGGMSEYNDERALRTGFEIAGSLTGQNATAAAALCFFTMVGATAALIPVIKRFGTAEQASAGIKK